ncbi:hypothetical protein AB0442_36035 [Kitasatospora sp. NPDC085895]|uniref:hypothetical protein n=1 Tax=Kitasatospora sp. NPDC085895 TaxID=3155057 RepID=UPI00344CE4B6
MKHGTFLQELRKIARAKGLDLELVRHGANHDLYELGTVRLTVPRHPDVNELTARSILKEANKA